VLARLPVSTLCDVDKSLPVVDPAIRPQTAHARLCGPAYTVVAAGEFLSTLWAIAEATVSSGHIVVADGDGMVIAPPAQLEACLELAARIERTEAAVLAGIEGGASLVEMTNLADHVAALRSGQQSKLSITPPG
jgi:regulator of RNase E activity RraA